MRIAEPLEDARPSLMNSGVIGERPRVCGATDGSLHQEDVKPDPINRSVDTIFELSAIHRNPDVLGVTRHLGRRGENNDGRRDEFHRAIGEEQILAAPIMFGTIHRERADRASATHEINHGVSISDSGGAESAAPRESRRCTWHLIGVTLACRVVAAGRATFMAVLAAHEWVEVIAIAILMPIAE